LAEQRIIVKRSLTIGVTGVALGALLVGAGLFGPLRSGEGPARPPVGALTRSAAAAGDPHIPVSGSLDNLTSSLQDRLKAVPNDHVSWATLGLAYVQQAKVTVDPSFYPRADDALGQSLVINRSTNFLAYAGLSALASARHDFSTAKTYAEQGLAINSFSSILYGALSDAELQLGNYDAAIAAVQRMVDLSPDTTSLARASYTWELRGNIDEARRLMRRALDDAATASNRAFALVHLGGLAADQGDANAALTYYRDALVAAPDDAAALAGKAKAEAALGQVETALDDYAAVVARAPEPGYIVEYARLLESVGRTQEAEAQYRVVQATQRLFAANGVEPDAVETLLEVERGNVAKAVADAERGIASRPFVAMHDAHAWALHAAGRHGEARVAIDRAKALGTRSALFEFHDGMISLALGDTTRARTALTAALAINPNFDPLSAKAAREALASIGGAS
jgi:tetratricopeptide (TPR) repeat protein